MRTKLGSASLLLLLLLAWSAPSAADDKDSELEGVVELLYRSVNVNGSQRKYDEDFNGLGSGARLGNLSLNWLSESSNLIDYARLDANGLGGEPYERAWLRVGRKNAYELSINSTKQAYIYNLFELTRDLDGHTWNSERRRTDVNLKIRATDKVDVLFRFEDGSRSGSSLFMKNVERQLFRMDTPLDQNFKRYTVGGDFELGNVDIVLRQSFRRYENRFNNFTANDLGLDDETLTSLNRYEWVQNDRGSTDWTTLKVHAPFGDRADLTVGLAGTFVGKEEVTSRVELDADGTSWSGTCSVSGLTCESNADCEPVSNSPGDLCVADPFTVTDGISNADLEGDVTLVNAELRIKLVALLDLILQYHSLERNLRGSAEHDLDGDGVPVNSDTRLEYETSTATAMLDYRPIRQFRVRAGYRSIDRKLNRNGFTGARNVDFVSTGDGTAIVGLTTRPVSWFRFNLDYEAGDVSQPFTAVAAQEREHGRARVSFLPRKEIKLDISYIDFENRNLASDFRPRSLDWDTLIKGTTWSGSFWHQPSGGVDYMLNYAQQEIDNSVFVVFDQDGFGAVEPGDSLFANDNTQYSGQVNFRWARRWAGHVRLWYAESDGNNVLVGEISGVVDDQIIMQEFRNAEVGLIYTFESGIFLGASARSFDYDDYNDLLDYDGEIFTLRLGTNF
jgi:hypothetical protein